MVSLLALKKGDVEVAPPPPKPAAVNIAPTPRLILIQETLIQGLFIVGASASTTLYVTVIGIFVYV